MAFDGIFLAAIKQELSNLIGNRVDRIFQPEKETLILHLRKGRDTKKLLLCSLADQARVHLTTANFKNPSNPPLFCMVLRKHLEGSILADIVQPGLERILKLHFDTTDELGRPSKRILIIEIMSKHSNIILINTEGMIIDAIRRYTHAVSRHREVLPGKSYISPPAQKKANICDLDEESLTSLLFSGDWDTPIRRLLVEKLEGIGPETAREVIYQCGLSENMTLEECGEYEFSRIYQVLNKIRNTTIPNNWHPVVIKNTNERPLAFAAFDLKQYDQLPMIKFSTPSEACDNFYSLRRHQQILEGLRRSLEHTLDRELKRCYKKENIQAETVDKAKGAEKYRLKGELITANIYRLTKGEKILRATNFYDESGKTITIELDPSLTPSENAQLYFNRYNKVKKAAKLAQEQLEQTRAEISYLESIAQALNIANTMEDLSEIQQELRQAGYIPVEKENKPGKKAKKASQTSKPLEFVSPDNFKILVGKNNRQNDWLTLKHANSNDIWLHTKDIPGSHVIIKTENREVPATTLEMAARLAAHYSKAKQSSQVPVDYTSVKHVRKPNGTKPGMVIYDNQNTVYVKPLDIEEN
ncbi:MAG: hypothetical protein PWP31_678 [Clostridia bacterium]|nr:hypothetical protein [Clostridia bacterium]